MKFNEWIESLNDKELSEYFDKRVPYKDKSKKLIGSWEFEIDDKTYTVDAFEEAKSVYKILFSYKEGSMKITSLTNFGKASEVIGMVMDIVEKEIIKKHKPTEFNFESIIGKRSKVYDRIIGKHMLPKVEKYRYKLYTENKENLPMKVYRFVKE
ncbi:hypothetical protein KKF82_06430 [Patescibacteria group bacterium]|nr:hypothetical protein [Patescibacteria group bacterium]